ncbi:MAG: hypothetical protein IKP06_02195 [Elusimicrobiaceae bacterium]|nr:hypothetical protein [Elusimicrobiaceae bacterium]
MRKFLFCLPLLCALCCSAQNNSAQTADMQREVSTRATRAQWTQILKKLHGNIDEAVKAYGKIPNWGDRFNSLNVVNSVSVDKDGLLIDLITIEAWVDHLENFSRVPDLDFIHTTVVYHRQLHIIYEQGYRVMKERTIGFRVEGGKPLETSASGRNKYFFPIDEATLLWKGNDKSLSQQRLEAQKKYQAWREKMSSH